MLDLNGRGIDYLRISVTDRCNLRCAYCMPEEGVEWMDHGSILRYEDILRLCRLLGGLGVTKFKLTGGEPLVRKGLPALVEGLKAIPTTESVTLTTNGVLLAQQLPELLEAGLDGVNISLDTLDRERYRQVTRRDLLPRALEGLEAAANSPGLNVKVNCVPMGDDGANWARLAALARDRSLAVRFIELMPIGLGKELSSCAEARVREELERSYGVMTPWDGTLGNGPCRYFTLPGFRGKIGFISAMSHKFCHQCNRVRLTASGFLKTCLQYETGVDLAPLLDGSDQAILEAVRTAILRKPTAHRFEERGVDAGEVRRMNEIGG